MSAGTRKCDVRPGKSLDPLWDKPRDDVVWAPEERVDLLSHRRARGLDLFTGEPLKGDDAREWLRLRYGNNSGTFGFNVEEIVKVDTKTMVITLRMRDGRIGTGPLPPETEEDVVEDDKEGS
jgi:hypothetical protein